MAIGIRVQFLLMQSVPLWPCYYPSEVLEELSPYAILFDDWPHHQGHEISTHMRIADSTDCIHPDTDGHASSSQSEVMCSILALVFEGTVHRTHQPSPMIAASNIGQGMSWCQWDEWWGFQLLILT